MKLTPAERLIYAKLLEIEMMLKPEIDNVETVEALEHGYQDFCRLDFIYDELSDADSKYVGDVFQMYERIQDALMEDGELTDSAKFPGFDGNNETALVGFARYLVRNGRWTHVIGATNDFPNSHGSQRNYRGMLERFREITGEDGHGFTLSADEAREFTDTKWITIGQEF